MSVFLGNNGSVALRRDAINQALTTNLGPGDVNTQRRRFSVDFAAGALITGDQITIATTDKSPLQLVDGHVDAATGDYYPDWRGYVHVDDVGGLRLYNSFENSVAGQYDNALVLIQPTTETNIAIKTRDSAYNCLAKITSYEVTTSRDQVQTDVLGDEFRTYYERGLISGQGRLDCFWEHESNLCVDNADAEFSSYLARLCIRLQQGSSFDGRFFVYNTEGSPAVWYEMECLVTNVALAVQPTQMVTTQIQFVATGPITLHTGMPKAFLLQEDKSLILQEDGSGIQLEDSD